MLYRDSPGPCGIFQLGKNLPKPLSSSCRQQLPRQVLPSRYSWTVRFSSAQSDQYFLAKLFKIPYKQWAFFSSKWQNLDLVPANILVPPQPGLQTAKLSWKCRRPLIDWTGSDDTGWYLKATASQTYQPATGTVHFYFQWSRQWILLANQCRGQVTRWGQICVWWFMKKTQLTTRSDPPREGLSGTYRV